LYTELFEAIIPTYIVSLLFADLLFLHIVIIILNAFILIFFSSRCMLQLKFAIYHRAARCMQYWLKTYWLGISSNTGVTGNIVARKNRRGNKIS